MLDNLLNLVKEHAGDAIINNPAIPNEHNDAAVATASEGIFEGLKNQLGSGGLDGIKNLFSGGDVANNPMVTNISQSVAQSIAGKFGVDGGTANNIVQSLIPTVMDKLVKKTNDPNDSSFDLGGIMNSLGGEGGIGGMIGGLFK